MRRRIHPLSRLPVTEEEAKAKVSLVLQVLWVTRDVLIWALVALFLAMALSPAVEYLQSRGIRRRGVAVAIVFVVAILVIPIFFK